MTVAAFELDWMGGAAERAFRRARPGVDELPWHLLDPTDHRPELVARARAAFTEGAIQEYAAAASFASLVRRLLEARAPLDLIGMAADFVADELHHVELNARVAMALGGAAPRLVDFEGLVPAPPTGGSATHRACELAVRLCCVGESLSVPALAGARDVCGHPLIHAVLSRIAADEAPHAAFGWRVLAWARERLDERERERLVAIADEALDAHAALAPRPDATCAFSLAEVHALGWLDAPAWRAAQRKAAQRVRRRMARALLG